MAYSFLRGAATVLRYGGCAGCVWLWDIDGIVGVYAKKNGNCDGKVRYYENFFVNLL